jgi:hypothetical protein
MKQKSKKIFAITVIAAAVLLAAAGIVYLPDTLVVKISLSGDAGKTMPKLLALAIPTLISIGFALVYLLDKKEKRTRTFGPLWSESPSLFSCLLQTGDKRE